MQDEILDIVDNNDRVIGQKYRTEIYQHNMNNFRVINAFLVNNNDEVWIPRRSPKKKLFPLCLDASVGGHVNSGESYLQAFKRELKEELNLHLSEIKYLEIAKLTPQEHHVSAFMRVYLIKINKSPQYNTDDFVEAQWFNLNYLETLINQGEPTKGDLPTLLVYLKKQLKNV